VIDVGLMATIAIMLTIPAVFIRPWPPDALRSGVLDTSLAALFAGVVVGRLTSLAFDDPGSLTSLSDLLIIRSGVEFWPGLIAGLVCLAIGARRDHILASLRLAALMPAALVAWAAFEATCLVRDGCPGPESTIGLRPDGLVTTMFPIGIAVAACAIAAAVILGRWHRSGAPSIQVAIAGVGAVAGIRSIASIWLPHIGSGPTRQHRESIAAAALSAAAMIIVATRNRHSPAVTPLP
jgi:hypothetical protein